MSGAPKTVDGARHYLLPGLWSVFGDSSGEADIAIDSGNLLVIAKNDKRELAFCITGEAIKDGTYADQFANNLRSLHEMMVAP